jgi:hypothetical protein
MTRARSKCWRSIHGRPCGCTWEEHHSVTRACPDGDDEVHTFRSHASCPTRVGQSFSHDEVELLASLFLALTRGADVRVLLRSPHFASVAGKVLRMRKRITAEQSAAEHHEQRTPLQSNGGTSP